MKKIYINGEFITLENKTCEAILIEDKIISKVGMKKDILKYADDNTEIIDLKGKIEIKDNRLTGLLEENSYIEYIKKVPMPDIKELLEACKKAQDEYLKYGITTVQEGMFSEELIPIYKEMIKEEILKIDVVTYMDIKSKEKIKEEFHNNIKKYYKHMKIQGYKIFLDGSLQLRTAWMKTTYKTDNINNKNNDNKNFGISTMKDEEVEKAVRLAEDENMQILAHCNGDMAARQFIDVIKKQKNVSKIRPVMIHAQLLRIEDLKEVKGYGIIPSFFVAHTYYWGDTHIKNFGLDRASKISPAKTTLKNNILFTFQQDSPVIEPNMFETIWCAVKRKTKKGILLGKEEQISVSEAIKAVTINAAYQYFEENTKGSIKEGKFANLIIVNKNLLKVKIDEIKDIEILETIKEGTVIYKN